MLAVLLVFTSLIALVSAGCDNGCSGHGTCGQRGVCSCYDNWGMGLSLDTGDCSERICPFEFAWVDTPNKIGSFHKYAECSNRGICNRDSGECECFPGYEGKGCQRTMCPNDCSGHGRCKFIENLPYGAVATDYYYGTFLPQSPHEFDYFYWDKTKTRGCVCDPEYGDVDCSKRLCQYGNDVMDQRDVTTNPVLFQTQTITIIDDNNPIIGGNFSQTARKTFALTFKSKLNESFTTEAITMFSQDLTDFHQFVLDVQLALLKLPNKVIDGVEVHGSLKTNEFAEATLNITFVGENVQGPQNKLVVKSILCADGCTPKLSGLELLTGSSNVTETMLSDYNSYECGRRGKCDYETGLCNCFGGYTGLGCNTITSLV